MARKIILKEDGLVGSGTVPSGYKYLGDNGGDISQKIGATVSSIGGGSTALTAIVNIPSAQILEMGTSPIDLLPGLSNDQIYDIQEIILKVTNANYTHTGNFKFTINRAEVIIRNDVFTDTGNTFVITSANPQSIIMTSGIPTLQMQIGGRPNTLTTVSGLNPTVGTGSAEVIITYTIRTFGV